MKIEKKIIEVETVTFDKKDIATVEEAFGIIATLYNKIIDIEQASNYFYETTSEEGQILDFAEKIHSAYVNYSNTF